MVVSLCAGSKYIPLSVIIDSLLGKVDSADSIIIQQGRVTRTIMGLLVGAALGAAGAIIQAVTRNPLADPGIFGVNSGASFAIILGAAFFGAANLHDFLWFAFAGAMVTSVVVYITGTMSTSGRLMSGSKANPVRLTLAGIAIGAVLYGISQGIALLNPSVFDTLRFWNAGSLDVKSLDIPMIVAPAILIGLIIALLISRSLNAINMGKDLAAALGARVLWTQFMALISISLLCGGATAAAGPISFVGLMMPHVARWMVGPNQSWILPFTMILTPILLLASDIVGRFLVPGEMRVSIVTAFIGAPVLIWLVRSRKTVSKL